MIKCREGFQSIPAAPFTWRCFQPLQFCFASCAEMLADSSTSASLRTCTRFGDNYRTAGHPVFRLPSGCDTMASAPPWWICLGFFRPRFACLGWVAELMAASCWDWGRSLSDGYAICLYIRRGTAQGLSPFLIGAHWAVF